MGWGWVEEKGREHQEQLSVGNEYVVAVVMSRNLLVIFNQFRSE